MSIPQLSDGLKNLLLLSVRRRACARKASAIFVPVAVSILVFLVAYNNSASGKTVLALAAASAILLWVVPRKWLPRYIDASSLRLASVYAAVPFASWLFLELVFPYTFPQEYAQIMDITKAIRGADSFHPPSANDIFENEDQHINVKKQSDTLGKGLTISWHRPGERFQYYGYDPNSGVTYLNRFFWNSRGYFDHDRSLMKPLQTKRIVVIGDSYVEAVQVPLSKTFHKRMEAILNDNNRRYRSDTTFEVIALGNSGTGQLTSLNVLRQEGLAYHPDLVVFTVCSNDFCDDDPVLKNELILAAGELGPLTRGLVRRHLMAAALAVWRVQTMRRSRVTVSPELLQWSSETLPQVEKAWERTLGYVRQAKIICDREDSAFLLVYLGAEIELKYALDPANTLGALRGMGPVYAGMHWDMSRSIKRVERYCADHNINFISVLEPLIRAQKQTGQRVFWDHYTIFGHEIVGRILACTAWRCLVTYPYKHLHNVDECLKEDDGY